VEPEYACALASDARGWWLLQLRPPDARLAPGQLTCFGGRREGAETAEACLRRELREECGWEPEALSPAVELWERDRYIARFYRARLDLPPVRLRLEPGHAAILAPPPALPGLPVSPWHRRVLEAAAAGRERVDLAASGPAES
jgi:8-oxo-dGTP pyrophosphatase MutT (NUDIX family)